MLTRLIAEERIGIGLALLALALGLTWAALYQRFSLLALVPWLLFFIVVLGFALGRGIDAVKDRDLPSSIRWRKGLAIPLIVGSVLVLDKMTGLTSRTSAYAFLWTHGDELAAAKRLAGPADPSRCPTFRACRMAGWRSSAQTLNPPVWRIASSVGW